MGKNLENIKEQKVKIGLDRVRYVKFGFNAFALLEEKFGDLEKAMEAFSQGKMKNVLTLLWAGLQDDLAEGEVLTEEQLGKMLNLNQLKEIGEAIAKALQYALPDSEEGNQKNV